MIDVLLCLTKAVFLKPGLDLDKGFLKPRYKKFCDSGLLNSDYD